MLHLARLFAIHDFHNNIFNSLLQIRNGDHLHILVDKFGCKCVATKQCVFFLCKKSSKSHAKVEQNQDKPFFAIYVSW